MQLRNPQPYTMLTPVHCPDGFELREARAARAGDGTKWLPEDALFDASEAMKENPPCAAFLVAWYTRMPNGKLALKYRCSHEHDRQTVALAADLLADLQG